MKRMTRVWTLLAMALGGCETMPKVVQGRKVIGSRWVQGVRVYVLEPDENDRLATENVVKESAEAAKGIVFQSTAQPRK